MSSLQRKTAQKICIYWDYENCPIPPQATTFGNVVNVIKRRIFKSIGQGLHCDIKLYIKTDKIPPKLQRAFDINGVKHFQIPSYKPEAVDKRMLVDLALDLYEWKGLNCNAVALITGDQDFGNILARIRNVPEIAKLILIRIPKPNGLLNECNKELFATVDDIMEDFKINEFIDCRHGNNCNRNIGQCQFYHHSQKTQIQSPSSSVSNMSVPNTIYLEQEEKKFNNTQSQPPPPPQQNGKQAARSKIKCQFGDKCKHWKSGNCEFFHPKPYEAPQSVPTQPLIPPPNPIQQSSNKKKQTKKTKCRYGNQCRYQNLHCPFLHPGQEEQSQNNNYNNNNNQNYAPHMNIAAQQQLAQHQQQHIQYQLDQLNGNNNNNYNYMQQPAASGGNINTISYEQLLLREFGGINVDRRKLETYLSDREFQNVFKTTKQEFEKLAPWKKETEKRKAGLW